MIFDCVRRGSPAEEDGGFLRKMEFIGEGRKRMRLRRFRSLDPDYSSEDSAISSDFEAILKKRRSEIAILDPKLIENKKFRGRSYGTSSVIGRRRQMEDAVAVELGFLKKGERSYDFFGVYDGHGGRRVAQACGETLHKLVVRVVAAEGGDVDWGEVMAEGFKEMDEEVSRMGKAVASVGSTAVVAVVGDEEVVVANCGDSRAVISRGGVAVPLSDDHKPDRPDELERIELSGGKVINWNGRRVLGVLATSRSIGDRYLKPFVTADPEVKVIERTDADEFLILASDGLWDVVSNDLACQVARRCLNGQLRRNSRNRDTPAAAARNRASEAAALLAKFAVARGSGDNVSVIVVELNQTENCRIDTS